VFVSDVNHGRQSSPFTLIVGPSIGPR
jgi:hypothetical protein